MCSNYRGVKLLSLSGKADARVLEKRFHPIVELRIQYEECRYLPGHGTVDQPFILLQFCERSWECADPLYTCLMDLEKAYVNVPQHLLWEVFKDYEVCGSPIHAIWALYEHSESCFHILGDK